jgi:hypothetical protein
VNDLQTINRLNAEAIERDIPRQQAKGKYVVAEYRGLNFFGYSTHSSEAKANAYACELGLHPGCRTQVYRPTMETCEA